MIRGWWMIVAAVTPLLGPSHAAAARIAVSAARSELLYSSSAEGLSCTDLSKMQVDSALPFNIVRLHAEVPANVPADQVQVQWSFPKPALGMLLADADLGPDEQIPAIRSACAELGNGCVLTQEQLLTYNKPSILWIAPGCDVLPDNTARPFPGGHVRIGVRVSVGNRRLGTGAARIGFGRLGSLTLLVADPGGPFRDGIGKPSGEKIFINPAFGVRFDPKGAQLPDTDHFEIESGGGSPTLHPPCRQNSSLTACTNVGDILYASGGKQIASARAILTDGSALCDKLTVDIRTTAIIPKLEVTLVPKRDVYVPGDATKGSVGLRVRLHNASPAGGGGNILLVGNVLSCQTEVRVGKSTLTKTTQIDLQHCSSTVDQACLSDADCAAPNCDHCEAQEVCLTSDHCSANTLPPLGCTNDADCRPPRCPKRLCSPDDICVKVLPLDQVFLGVGASVDLIESTIPVANVLPATARIVDSWTVHTFNAGDDSDVVKYKIAPRPAVKPALTP